MSDTTERCEWCGGNVIPGTTCPRSLPCRRCGAQPGQSCKRPSGHRADQLHAGRIGDAERLDAALAAPGLGLPHAHETQLTMHVTVESAS